MREMKDSGIAWIGEIPSEWEVVRVKDIYRERTELSESGTEKLLSVSEYYGVAPTAEKINEGEFITRAESLIGYKKCYKDDFVSNIMLAWKGSFGTTKHDGIVSPAYCVYKPVDEISPNYYHYLFRTDLYKSRFKSYSKGIIDSRLRLYSPFFYLVDAILPPENEQQSIASFLDKKCGEIDSLISLQEEMINELQAYKQSVITEAVTLGTERSVKLVDSGEEWLGKIPVNWSLLPIKALFDKRNQKNNPIISTERLSLSIGLGITKYADKTTNLDRYKDDFTAYQIAYPNDIVLNSMNMIVGAVGKSTFMGCVSPVYYVITAKECVNPDFFGYLLNTPKIRDVYHSLGRGIYAIERGDGRVNTCRLKVPYYDFSIIKVPVPPYEEQTQIAAFINDKLSQIDSLIAIKREKIEELKDYKKSIIYEYVTGKKRVI